MTLQEIFTKAATHLLTQNKRSMLPPEAFPGAAYPDNTCAYRGSNGTACAVGCLIQEEHYDPETEGKQVSSTAVRTALNLSGVPTDYETMQILGSLQRIHDCYQPHAWPKELRALADSYNMEMPK